MTLRTESAALVCILSSSDTSEPRECPCSHMFTQSSSHELFATRRQFPPFSAGTKQPMTGSETMLESRRIALIGMAQDATTEIRKLLEGAGASSERLDVDASAG